MGRVNTYREILRVAIPVSFEAVFQASFNFIGQIVVGVLGVTAVAAVGLSSSVSFIVALLYSAVGTGSGVLVAQAFGRQDMKAVSRGAALGQILATVFGGMHSFASGAKKQAGLVLRLGLIVGLIFSASLVVASFLLPVLYPRVGKDVVHLAFWSIIITACVQAAKVLNNILGNGILPSGGDTKFVLLTHIISSYAAGLPAAVLLGIVAKLGAQSIFAARALEEVLKVFIFLLRYRTPSWYRKSMKRPAAASSNP